MRRDGQQQTVPKALLETRLGRTLSLNETFTTKLGTWKIIYLGSETYTVEKISDATTDSNSA